MVRLGLAGLAAANLWWGAWAALFPQHFFETFPGFGRRWTAAYPPYNEHLVTDLGATFLTLGLLLAVAAVMDDRRLRRAVISGVVVFNTLHLVFHARQHGTLAGSDLGESLATLALGVVAPVLLFVLDRPPKGTRAAAATTRT